MIVMLAVVCADPQPVPDDLETRVREWKEDDEYMKKQRCDVVFKPLKE